MRSPGLIAVLAVCGWLSLGAFPAPAGALEATVDFREVGEIEIGPAELAADTLLIHVPGWTDTLYLAPADAPVSDWKPSACALVRDSREPFRLSWQDAPSDECAAVLSTHRDTRYLVRLADRADEFRLDVAVPRLHRAEAWLMRLEGSEPEAHRYTTNIRVEPAQAVDVGPIALSFLFDGRWKRVCLDGPAVEGSEAECGDGSWGRPSGHLDALDLREPPGVGETDPTIDVDVLLGRLVSAEPKPVLLVAMPLDGELRLRTFRLYPEPAPLPPSPPEVLEDLVTWCDRSTGHERDRRAAAAGQASASDRRSARWHDAHWFYSACVDLRDPSRPEVLVRTSVEGVDPVSDHGNTHLFAQHPVVVQIRHLPSATPSATFRDVPTGEVIDGLPIRRTGAGEEGDTATIDLLTRVGFEPMLGHRFVELGVDFTRPEGGTRGLNHRFTVEGQYLGAVRVGLGTTYAPTDRAFALTPSGNEAGDQQIEVTAGEDSPPGTLDMQITVGYSAFFRPMATWSSWRHGRPSRQVGMSWFTGLGVVSAGSHGFRLLGGAWTGPELAVGTDLAVALLVGVRRARILESDLQAGMQVPADYEVDQALRHGVVFAAGLAIHVSPAAFRVPARPRSTGNAGGS